MPVQKRSAPSTNHERYEVKALIGDGGMGRVYKAYDTVIKRDVALKTILGIPDPMMRERFRSECEALSKLSHPNLIEIFDIGEFEEDGERKPYFTMPLLPGKTLDHLIRRTGERLTVVRSVEIIVQVCRGLQAAHDAAIVHRDLKPSNIFVMPDDTVKIIDFGVACVVDHRQTMTIAGGSLFYMAPEQIDHQRVSHLADLFSLGVVFYEMLTLQRPFCGQTDEEIAQAIRNHSPTRISELNSEVNQTISRVVQKALAKRVHHRFECVKEFADILLRAHRNQPIQVFEPTQIQRRIHHAKRAFEEGDFPSASDIVAELEPVEDLDPAILALRDRIQQGERRKRIQRLLASGRTHLEDGDFGLAEKSLAELLSLDEGNADAVSLKQDLEIRIKKHEINESFSRATEHLEKRRFEQARSSLKNVLRLDSKNTRALEALDDVDRHESICNEKDKAHQSALAAWKSGDVNAALAAVERFIELDRLAPDTALSERTSSIKTLHNQVRNAHRAFRDSNARARHHLASGDFSLALWECDQHLAKYPTHKALIALRFIIKGKELWEQNRFDEGLDALRGAFGINEQSAELRKELGETLLEQADKRFGEDPLSALVLVQQTLKWDNANERALRLFKRIQDQQRDLFVIGCLARISQLEADGSFDAALTQIREALSAYPDEERLQNKEASVTAARDESDLRRDEHVGERKFPNEPVLFSENNKVSEQTCQETLQNFERRVRQCFARGDLDQAARHLGRRIDLSEDPRWQGLSAELDRRHRYESLLSEADDLCIRGDLEGAQRKLLEASTVDPSDDRVELILKKIAAGNKLRGRSGRWRRLRSRHWATSLTMLLIISVASVTYLVWPKPITRVVQSIDLRFSYVDGSSDLPQPQTITFSQLGSHFRALCDQGWITVTPEVGERLHQLQVSVDPKDLRPRTYTGKITIHVSGRPARNETISIGVRLDVKGKTQPAPSPEPTVLVTLDLSPKSLDFTYAQDGQLPDTKDVRVLHGAILKATPSADWLHASYSKGGRQLRVSVSPFSLVPNEYNGYVAVRSSDYPPLSEQISVHLSVLAKPADSGYEPVAPASPLVNSSVASEPVGNGCSPVPFRRTDHGSFSWEGQLKPKESLYIDQSGEFHQRGKVAWVGGIFPPDKHTLTITVESDDSHVVFDPPNTDNKCRPLKLTNADDKVINKIVVHWSVVDR